MTCDGNGSDNGMTELAIIGGTGLTSLSDLEIVRREVVTTPYGDPSGPFLHGHIRKQGVIFLARHGYGHTIPPHEVNYRANLWALRSLGVREVLAVAAVGGINPRMQPGGVVVPDQIIDYTWGRAHTFFEGDLEQVTHIDFTEPYCDRLRGRLLQAARAAGVKAEEGGTYGATQGPRLESAAEIDRLERDGCDIVGMTGMPEAALARELGLSYACCAVVANRAAGRGETSIHADIEAHLSQGVAAVKAVVEALLRQ
jgi:5'-methylthioinosine phosphorylase